MEERTPIFGTIAANGTLFTVTYAGTERSTAKKEGYSFETFKGSPPELPIVDFRTIHSVKAYFEEVSNKCMGVIEAQRQPYTPGIDLGAKFTPVPMETFFQYCRNSGATIKPLSEYWNEINWPEPGNGDTAFITHGGYQLSNACWYEVELSPDGEGARLRMYDSNGATKVSRWLEVEHVENPDAEEEEDRFWPVIDPEGFDIPLELVFKI